MSIAVVVPFHDQHEALSRCLDSISCQTVRPSIVVVVDDGSTRPLESLPHGDLIILPENRGVQVARNAGFDYVRRFCDTVIFCDADVVWKENAFARFANCLESNPKAAYAYGDYDRDGLVTGRFHSRPFSAETLRQFNFVTTMSMVRVECLPDPPFVEDEERLQDWSLWLRMLAAGHEGVYTGWLMFSTEFWKESVSCRGVADYEKWRRIVTERYVQS